MHAQFTNFCKKIFTLDYRALAFLRIATALLVITDLIRRSADLIVHYTNAGAMPKTLVATSDFYFYTPSIFLLSGDAWFQVTLFIITGLFAVLLLFGYRTKIVAVILWYLVLSLQTSNPFILQRGDSELMFMLFWGMFLPWNKRFSIDSAYQVLPISNRIFTAATAAFIIQVGYVYFFAFLHKCQSVVWCGDFTAVHYAFSGDSYSSDIARFLLGFPTILQILTLIVVVIQMLTLPALLSPIKNTLSRILIITLLIGMHVSFIFTLHIGLFAYISIAALIALYPTSVWDWLGGLFYPKQLVTIYYDENCHFCHRSVQLIKTFLLRSSTVIKPAQSDPSIYADMQTHDSWVVVNETGERFFTFDAGVEIVRHSPFRMLLIPFSRLPGMHTVGEYAYRFIANKRSSLPLPKNKRYLQSNLFHERPWRLCSAVIILGILVHITLGNITSVTRVPLPQATNTILSALRLNQDWGVFAPIPNLYDGWYVLQASTTDGQILQRYPDGKTASLERPDDVAATYLRQRWRKYLNNMYFDSYSLLREDYLQWHCREYNSLQQTKQMTSVELTFFLEETTATSSLPIIQQSLHKTSCD